MCYFLYFFLKYQLYINSFLFSILQFIALKLSYLEVIFLIYRLINLNSLRSIQNVLFFQFRMDCYFSIYLYIYLHFPIRKHHIHLFNHFSNHHRIYYHQTISFLLYRFFCHVSIHQYIYHYFSKRTILNRFLSHLPNRLYIYLHLPNNKFLLHVFNCFSNSLRKYLHQIKLKLQNHELYFQTILH